MRRIAWFPGALALAALAAGCVGQIGDPAGGAANGLPEDDPGRVTMHRLNKVEYNNTVRDLLGTKLTPADDFPADDISYGFDNISDVLTTSPLHVELYERSAELLIEEAMSLPTTAKTTQTEAETLMGTAGQVSGDAWNLYSSGEVGSSVPFPTKGEYKISARVWGDQAGSEPAKANLLVGGVPFGPFDVSVTESAPIVIATTAVIEPGNKQVSVEFTNDYYDSVAMADRNLYVDWIRVEGPLNQPGMNEQRDRIVICDLATGQACAKQILAAFGLRAWRRPLTDGDGGAHEARGPRRAAGRRARGRPEGGAPGDFDGALFRVPGREGSGPELAHAAPARRLRARLEDLVLPVEQHARRRAARRGQGRVAARHGGAQEAGRPDAR
jgi:hypothetical protein